MDLFAQEEIDFVTALSWLDARVGEEVIALVSPADPESTPIMRLKGPLEAQEPVTEARAVSDGNPAAAAYSLAGTTLTLNGLDFTTARRAHHLHWIEIEIDGVLVEIRAAGSEPT